MGSDPKGYITQVRHILDTTGRSYKFNLMNAGVGGNKIYDLYLRLDNDVISKQPDIVFIFVGVNDVMAKFTTHTGTDPDRFEHFYDTIIKKVKANGSQVILCTPLCFGEKKDRKNLQDADLDKYAQLVRDIAKRNSVPLCDLRKMFLEYIQVHNPSNKVSGILTTDRVHPNDLGNVLIAQEMAKFLR